jgi:hypothetical protein
MEKQSGQSSKEPVWAPWNSQQRVSTVVNSWDGFGQWQSWQIRVMQRVLALERAAEVAELYVVKGGALFIRPGGVSLLRLRLVQGSLFGGGMCVAICQEWADEEEGVKCRRIPFPPTREWSVDEQLNLRLKRAADRGSDNIIQKKSVQMLRKSTKTYVSCLKNSVSKNKELRQSLVAVTKAKPRYHFWLLEKQSNAKKRETSHFSTSQ